jgi:hypothetical protein
VPPRGMTLEPTGRALHSVNAVGRGSEKRAGWESSQDGVCPREGKREGEVPAKNCGNVRLEFTLLRSSLRRELWALLPDTLPFLIAHSPGTLPAITPSLGFQCLKKDTLF